MVCGTTISSSPALTRKNIPSNKKQVKADPEKTTTTKWNFKKQIYMKKKNMTTNNRLLDRRSEANTFRRIQCLNFLLLLFYM